MPKIVITAENIPEVLHLIETWNGKLTWPLLCEDIMVMLELDNVTRQALSGYKAIQEAYTARKQYLRENKNAEVQPVNSNIEYWQNQVESLEAELKRANKTIEMYKQRFVLWQHNAYIHGVRMESLDDAVEMLDKPLTEIKRRTGGV
jgi:predicted RNase H-like nuclease (RuvC/YqgF family)